MKAVNVRQLKNNPSEALREARKHPVIVLTLATEHTGPCLLVMDEALGRWHANARGLEVTGLAGVLIAARRAGIVDGVRPYLERLEENDFRMSDAVVQAVLDDAGETSSSERE